MASYVLVDGITQEYLEKTDAWGHTLTNDLQRARVYLNINAANRTAANTPRYNKGPAASLYPVEIEIRCKTTPGE
jgi:hypothetical protein